MSYKKERLLELLKEQGLPVVEDAADKALESVFQWLEESAKESKTPLDDLLLPVYAIVRQKIREKIDEIS